MKQITSLIKAFSSQRSTNESSFFEPIPSSMPGDGAILRIGETSGKPVVLLGKGSRKSVEWLTSYEYPHSPGCLAAVFSHFLDCHTPEDMALLATFGNPESATFFHYYELIQERLVHIVPEGAMSLNFRYFQRHSGMVLPKEKEWKTIFGLQPPKQGALSQGHFDLALAAQRVIEDLLFALAAQVRRASGMRELFLFGRQVQTPPVLGTLAQTGLFERIHPMGPGNFDAPAGSEKMDIPELVRRLTDGEVLYLKKNDRENYLLADPRLNTVRDQLQPLRQGQLPLPLGALALRSEAGAFLDMSRHAEAPRLSLKVREDQRLSLPRRYLGLPWSEKGRLEKSLFPAVTHADLSVWTYFPAPTTFPGKLLRAFHEKTACPLLGFGVFPAPGAASRTTHSGGSVHPGSPTPR